jgi:hypothetical protein
MVTTSAEYTEEDVGGTNGADQTGENDTASNSELLTDS